MGHGTQPELALAFLMAEYNCPPGKVENGICAFFKPTKIASLPNTMKKEMIEANTALKAFKDWTATMQLTSVWQAAYCGKAYSLVARMLGEQGVPGDLDGAQIQTALCITAMEILALADSCFEPSKPEKRLVRSWSKRTDG